MPVPNLWDVQQAADAILRFVAGLDESAYTASEVVHSAAERKFEIIGEALGQLSKLDPLLADRIPHRREIIAFRNLLIHGYAGVDHARGSCKGVADDAAISAGAARDRHRAAGRNGTALIMPE